MRMTIGVPREVLDVEKRVALTPETAARVAKLRYRLHIERGAGENASSPEAAYEAADVELVDGADDLWPGAAIVIKVRPPTDEEVSRLAPGKTWIGFLYPGQNADLVDSLNERKPRAVLAMDTVPRISRAQKLDALSSMANIAGYRAVVEAAGHLGRHFTGQITAAGRVPWAPVLVIGAGVAGLAAIGTARSIGAVVVAFDIRPEVAEQIASMGAEFLFLEFSRARKAAPRAATPSPRRPSFARSSSRSFVSRRRTSIS